MTAAEKLHFSAEDFLAWEATQDIKHEFADGIAYAMAGTTAPGALLEREAFPVGQRPGMDSAAGESHVLVNSNAFALLRTHLRGTPCRTFISDMKLKVEAADTFFYPDVFVTCAPEDAARKDYKTSPILVIEVLSPSTAAYDRGQKFAAYRRLPSLQEYVLIDSERYSVDVFRKDATDHWVLYPFGPGEEVELASVGLRLPIETLYEDVLPS
ncbi:Uma2 family endonuclease [Thiofaba sp. EF100]|uniref:Uma2 family endonuclease n=1 Tax=Thiofaba sp. EF100 TaxID=3121274 RepID=UPI003221B860